jgi:formylglycine-generating enzyme required for sulfatase activity
MFSQPGGLWAYFHEMGRRWAQFIEGKQLDKRPLREVGINPGMTLEVQPPKQAIIIVNPRPFLGAGAETLQFVYAELRDVGGFVNRIQTWIPELSVESYGTRWVLYDPATGRYFDDIVKGDSRVLWTAGIANEDDTFLDVRPPQHRQVEQANVLRRRIGKSPSKHVIAFLAIAAVLVVGGLIYLAFKASQSPASQPPPIAAVTRSPPAIATPTVEEKALPTPEMAVQPSAQPTAPVAVAIPSPSVSATPTKEELARRALDNATKDHPWVNSLGMKFVPVAGTQVLFSVWDTRVQDFETFVKNTDYDATGGMDSLGKDGLKQRGATWKEPGFSQGPTHPVVGVSWNDAEEFCKWLTKRERSAGDLPEDREYRLPKDEEWSVAVGLKNEAGSTPEEKSGKIALYPWDIPQKRDKNWPPPSGAGNYAGEEVNNGDWPFSRRSVIEGYNDGYPRTSPVGSFSANQFGLYDMGGNVWQWCEDWYNARARSRVLRGASWENFSWADHFPSNLLASSRFSYSPPDIRSDNVGFRCVVAVESSR